MFSEWGQRVTILKMFRPYGGLLCNYSTVLLQNENSHRQYVNTEAKLFIFENKTLFTKASQISPGNVVATAVAQEDKKEAVELVKKNEKEKPDYQIHLNFVFVLFQKSFLSFPLNKQTKSYNIHIEIPHILT